MTIEESKLRTAACELVGKECWAVIGGSQTERLNLRIGGKIPMEEPIHNMKLPEDVRNFDSDYILFIQCIWRIKSPEGIICGAYDSLSEEETDRCFDYISGRVIESVSLRDRTWDLVVEFYDGFKLNLFCDRTDEKGDWENYLLFTPTEIISVEAKSRLSVEKRNPGN